MRPIKNKVAVACLLFIVLTCSFKGRLITASQFAKKVSDLSKFEITNLDAPLSFAFTVSVKDYENKINKGSLHGLETGAVDGYELDGTIPNILVPLYTQYSIPKDVWNTLPPYSSNNKYGFLREEGMTLLSQWSVDVKPNSSNSKELNDVLALYTGNLNNNKLALSTLSDVRVAPIYKNSSVAEFQVTVDMHLYLALCIGGFCPDKVERWSAIAGANLDKHAMEKMGVNMQAILSNSYEIH